MSRQPISDEVQAEVLLRSRRRCALCFWLDGVDEVVKGQVAHLDQNNANAAADNLVFLCFNHHDEYDSRTSQSKGLRESEVRKWRDELYRELEYRFRTVRRFRPELTFDSLAFHTDVFKLSVRLKLTNAGSSAIHSPHISIRLPHGVEADVPRPLVPKFVHIPHLGSTQMGHELPHIRRYTDPFEDRQEFFEANGRVASISPCGTGISVLHAGYGICFDFACIDPDVHPLGSELNLDYRISEADSEPVAGAVGVPLIPRMSSRVVRGAECEGGPISDHFEDVSEFMRSVWEA